MELREPDSGDAERIREVARSAMTASYALSPQQIDAIVEAEFGDEQLAQAGADSDTVGFVAEDGNEESTTVVALALGGLDGNTGAVRWLLVDPEHRGNGIGTELFETTVETLRDRGVEQVQANTLKANADGSRFFERFEYVRTDERPVEFEEESLVEYVYTEPSAASGESKTDSAKTDAGEVDFPDAEVQDGVLTATADDGQQVYVDRDHEESGTEDSFFPAYEDAEFTERFGFYCANCGSVDISVDTVDRMRCGECGNSHASRSSESYDDSYL